MDRHLIDIDSSLLQALEKINSLSGATMTLFAIDADGMMLGTLTDGDIRRALLAGVSLDDSVSKAMHRGFKRLRQGAVDVETVRSCRQSGIRLIPVVDDEGHLSSILDLSTCHSVLPLKAVVMAGGKGERLRPLTNHIPKPLLEIGGKAIIDYNIEALARNGISDITVTINYLAELMREHFSKPVAGVKVKCVQESIPMGTIGAVSLCDIPPQGDTLVMNSDLLTTVSYEEMYLHHMRLGADITVAAIPYQVSVPYAILASDDGGDYVTGIQEKPSYSFFANAGIYIFSNKVLGDIPADRRTDATDLIESAIASGLKVVRYPINGTWIDVGSHTDFKQATELVRYNNAIGC